MASYTINTSRTREIGLKWSYDTYADKTLYPTQQAYLQNEVNLKITDLMYNDYLRAHSVALDKSIATIPEANMPAAQADIEAAIVANGGTLVPPGQVGLPPPLPPPIEIFKIDNGASEK